MRAFFAIFAIVLVSACDVAPTADSVAIPVMRNASPGPEAIGPEAAARSFDAYCARNYPGFAETRASVAADGFVQHATYGTYYHPRQHLSVKLEPPTCSMVFGSNASMEQVTAAFDGIDAKGGEIRFRPGFTYEGMMLFSVNIR